MEAIERIFRRSKKDGECLVCVMSPASRYPAVWFRGGYMTAHRISYTVHHGEIPPGMCVCHRCDNPRCVNPEHLFLGSNRENQWDKVRKGRQAYGSSHGRSKLTEADALAVRASEEPSDVLAERLMVSLDTIRDIRARRTWKRAEGASP